MSRPSSFATEPAPEPFALFHSGNLSVRSMAEVVSVEDFAGTINSEYLETVLVAVPKFVPPQSLACTAADNRRL